MKDVARSYAAAGYAVMWVYGMDRDDETGEWVCTCPAPNTKVCSPGKHPPFDGHGSGDATTDLDEINEWPEVFNLALACTETLVAIDIDDPDIASQLLADDIGLRDIATVSVTGRGIHILLKCAPSRSGILKRKDTNERLGEVRAKRPEGWGQYVVLPPSTHKSGRPYSWLGRTLLKDGPTLTQLDAWEYAKELFSWVGVEIYDKRDASVHTAREEGITAAPLPHSTRDAQLIILMDPQRETSDRSKSLYHLACALVRESKVAPLTQAQIAGVIKHVDSTRPHPRGPKYAWRDNADDYYWDLVLDAERAVEVDEKKKEDPQPVVTVISPTSTPTTYSFVEGAGFLYDPSGQGTNVRRVSNFEPVIQEALEIIDVDEREPEEVWVLRFSRGGDSYQFRVTRKERKNLFQTLQERLKPEYVIEPRQGQYLIAGMQYYSMERQLTSKSRLYGSTGWVREDAFLLPASRGAITPFGFDEEVRFDREGASEMILGFGSLVAEQKIDLAAVLHTLYETAPPSVMVPLMAQVWAAPLTSLGVIKSAAIIHLFGKTGSFKSSLARVATSVYGDFIDKHKRPIYPWTATPTSIEHAMHTFRDLPLLIDDYKQSMPKQQLVNLIQNYADGTSRRRMTKDLVEQKGFPPRCLIISTGEDLWDGQESILARTILISVAKEGLSEENLSATQRLGRDGSLQALGHAWITWLCTKGQIEIRRLLTDLQEMTTELAKQTAIGQEHARVLESLSTLLATDELFRMFLADKIPAFVDEYREVRKRGWFEAVEQAQELAEIAREFSPYNAMRTAVLEGIESRDVLLWPRVKDCEIVGSFGARTVGYVDHEDVLLSQETTYTWYKERVRRRGDAPEFSWQAWVDDAKTKGAYRKTHGEWLSDVGYRRMWRIPRKTFLEEETTTSTSDVGIK